MSNSVPVDPVVTTGGDANESTEDIAAVESLPINDEFHNKEEARQDAFQRGKKPGRPRKPRPEVLSLEEYDDDDYDPGAKEKVEGRKKGRPRSKPEDESPQQEKKKRGRPKDETRSNVTCDLCGKFFKYRVLLKRHEQTHYGIKEFECEICHKRFLQKGGLTVHLRQHTGERPYKCPYCPASFRGQSSLDCHVFRHTQQGTKCPQCPSVFATPAIVKQHIREVHITEKPHTCQICGESYKHRKSLTTHLEDHDKRICTVCGKVFNTMFALMTHRHIHEQNQKCTFCSRSFKSDEELQAHSKLRGRVFQCEMCCYSFNKAEFLNNHHRRDHWKELGLERLARKVVPRPKKPKPEGPKLRKSRIALPIVTIGSDRVDKLETNSLTDPSKEAIHQVEATVKCTTTESIEGLPTLDTNDETLPTKRELISPTKRELKKEGEEDQSDYDYNDDVHDYGSDEEDVKIFSEKAECLPKVEIKEEVDSQPVEATVPPSLEPGDFVKIEITETDKQDGNLEEEDPIDAGKTEEKEEQKEESSESEDGDVPLGDSNDEEKTEEKEEEKEKQSESEDDDVPLAVLSSKSRSKASDLETFPSKRKEKEPDDDSSDNGKLYSIGDPSDSDPSSSAQSSEEDDVEIEKPNPKRKRRRKQQGKRTVKGSRQKRSLKCLICGEAFEGRASLKEHRKSAHPDVKANSGPLICELCGKKYATITSLVVHRSQHKEYQRFKCDECPKAFTFQCYLENHIRIEHRNERLICPLCGKLFKYGPDLKRHSLQHEEDKPFKCEECPAAFRHPSALHSHKAIHEKLVFTCTICNKTFRYANSLRVHKRLHSGVKRFRCEICDREFSQKAPLMKHMSIHSVDRQVKCVVCDKVYYKKVELIIHQAKEHPNHPLIGKTIKIHACKICGMEFTKEGHLRIHSDIHGNEYRFKCDMCEDQKFKQKAGLRHHWKHFHHMEPPKRNLGKKPEVKKVEKVVVRTVTGAELEPPPILEINTDFDFMMQRIECEATGSN
ncbi:zinc finger protein 160-like [Aedes aegypti]|uniref:C2H2-type domain-containing protein n=1 Tax=Aedes aegypti TaxID=7159 RepID=A0A6I8U0R9_AEDAE|nr:zinc finger protein 160-like [Aedes aegypti]